MRQSQREVNQIMLHKRNTSYLKSITDCAHSNLGTDNDSLVEWEELSSLNLKPRSHKALATGQALSSIFLALEKELCSFFIHQGLEEKIPRPWPQAVTGSAMLVPGFEKVPSQYIMALGEAFNLPNPQQ